MSDTFWSRDFGAFVFGRTLLKTDPNAQLEFNVAQAGTKKGASESDFWEKGMGEILKSHTRFGRVGLFHERTNKEAKDFCNGVAKTKRDYSPTDEKRARKTPELTAFQMQGVCALANEGLADSVEFRRLMRKVLRHAKHAHCDSIFFLDAIMGEEKTRSILKHLAGPQIKLFFPDDFMDMGKPSTEKERKIKIESEDAEQFTRKIAEKILRTKLKK